MDFVGSFFFVMGLEDVAAGCLSGIRLTYSYYIMGLVLDWKFVY